jgi:hypothetical protein
MALIFLIYLYISNTYNSWGNIKISDNRAICVYNERTYRISEHFKTEIYNRKVGVIGGFGESRITFYEIPGMESEKWLAMKTQGLAYASIYKEMNTPEISLQEFNPTAVEFNNNGKKLSNTEIVSEVLKMINTNSAFSSLQGNQLLENMGINIITSIELYSDEYSNLIYTP